MSEDEVLHITRGTYPSSTFSVIVIRAEYRVLSSASLNHIGIILGELALALLAFILTQIPELDID